MESRSCDYCPQRQSVGVQLDCHECNRWACGRCAYHFTCAACEKPVHRDCSFTCYECGKTTCKSCLGLEICETADCMYTNCHGKVQISVFVCRPCCRHLGHESSSEEEESEDELRALLEEGQPDECDVETELHTLLAQLGPGANVLDALRELVERRRADAPS